MWQSLIYFEATTRQLQIIIKIVGQVLLIALIVWVVRHGGQNLYGNFLFSLTPIAICVASGVLGAWKSAENRTPSLMLTLAAWLIGAGYFVVTDSIHFRELQASGGHVEFGGVALTMFEALVALLLVMFGFALGRSLQSIRKGMRSSKDIQS